MVSKYLLTTVVIITMVTASHGTPKYNCTERGSCDSKIDKLSFNINCGCDKSCIAIGDCCHDYHNHGNHDKQHGGQVTLPTKPECVHISVIKTTTANNIAMVQTCPTHYENAYIKKRCESFHENLPITAAKIAIDFSAFVPVLGKRSEVLFINVFCAICNGEDESTFLDVEFQTRKLVSLEKILSIRDFTKHKVFPRIRIQMSHEDYTPRECRIAEDKCDQTWLDDETKLLCSKHAASFVYSPVNSATYKNKYCAKCNYVEEKDYTCIDPRPYLNSIHRVTLYPYSLLFDLNTGTITSRHDGPSKVEVLGMHLREKDCEFYEVYDPFHRECVNVLCEVESDQCHHFKLSEHNGEHSEKYDSDKSLDLSDNPGLEESFENSLNVSDIGGEVTHPCSTPLQLSIWHKLNMAAKLSMETGNNKTFLGISSNVLSHSILCTNTSWNGSPKAQPLDQTHSSYLGYPATYVTVVCNALSIAGLTAHIFIYGIFQSLRNTPGKCLMCLSFCLLMTQLLFTFAMGQTGIKMICFGTALTLHYCFISYFCWMTVLSFDIWHTFHLHACSTPVSKDNNATFYKYCLFAFGVPVVMVTISAVMDSLNLKIRPHYAEDLCWFSQQDGLLYFFDVPVAVTIAVNTTFLLLTIRNIINVSRNTEVARSQSSRKEKHRFFLYVKLSLVMGLTYITPFIAMAMKRPEFWYVFIIFNSLQGVWIFIAFVCTRKVFRLICESCGDRIGIKPISNRNSRSKTSCSTTKQTALMDSAKQETDKLTAVKDEETGKR